MSDTTIVSVEKHEVESFVALDHGNEKVRLSVFSRVGERVDVSIGLTPYQAEEVARELLNRAGAVRKIQKGADDGK